MNGNERLPKVVYEDEEHALVDQSEEEIGVGRVRPHVIGGNGEEQHKGEWYDSKSNAKRGLRDLYESLDLLYDLGELGESPDIAA